MLKVARPYNELSALEASRKLYANLSIIPLCGIRGDRFKRPNVSEWSSFQLERAGFEQVVKWFSSRDMIGIICGAVSGGLEVIDFEGTAEFPEWCSKVKPELGSEVFDRLPVCSTPSGGLHVYFRSEFCEGSQVLARSPDPKRGKGGLLIETRGQGGYVATGPGFGYRFIQGSPVQIPYLTATGRDIVVFSASSFNEVELPEVMPVVGSSDSSRDLPGHVFNREANWDDILEPHGWSSGGKKGHHRYWCRPGKDGGISAVTGYGSGRDWLCVFSSNVEKLQPRKLYTKFGAYAVLNHDGNFSDAASALYADGYQSPKFQDFEGFDFRGIFD